MISVHGESYMITCQGGRNRPRKKLLAMFVSYYLHKFLKLHGWQTKKLPQSLLLTVLRGFSLLLIQ